MRSRSRKMRSQVGTTKKKIMTYCSEWKITSLFQKINTKTCPTKISNCLDRDSIISVIIVIILNIVNRLS